MERVYCSNCGGRLEPRRVCGGLSVPLCPKCVDHEGAYKDGYEAGRDKGRAEGLEEGFENGVRHVRSA